MKRLLQIVTLALIVVPVASFAAVPQVVNYQGRLTDNSSQQNPLDATVTIDFSIWDAATGGSSLWSETQSVQVVKGLFSVLLGSTTPMPPSIFTSGDTRYLEIHVSGETLTPRQQIATVPFANTAARADDAGALGGVGAAGFQQRIAAPCPSGFAINAVAADGTATCIQGTPGPPGPPGPGLNTGTITGTVTNCSSPLTGVLVYVPGRSTTSYTASDGKYELDYLPAGTYDVQIKLPTEVGAKTLSGIAVTAGQNTAAGSTTAANVMTDVNNCGACGAACSSIHATPSCAGGSCTSACQTGFGDCNNDKRADGCETDLTSSVANCGACGAPCSSNHMTAECRISLCAGTCDPGYSNCDGNFRTNGCETDISSDSSNCGGCGHVCAAGTTCVSGSCV